MTSPEEKIGKKEEKTTLGVYIYLIRNPMLSCSYVLPFGNYWLLNKNKQKNKQTIFLIHSGAINAHRGSNLLLRDWRASTLTTQPLRSRKLGSYEAYESTSGSFICMNDKSLCKRIRLKRDWFWTS